MFWHEKTNGCLSYFMSKSGLYFGMKKMVKLVISCLYLVSVLVGGKTASCDFASNVFICFPEGSGY